MRRDGRAATQDPRASVTKQSPGTGPLAIGSGHVPAPSRCRREGGERFGDSAVVAAIRSWTSMARGASWSAPTTWSVTAMRQLRRVFSVGRNPSARRDPPPRRDQPWSRRHRHSPTGVTGQAPRRPHKMSRPGRASCPNTTLPRLADGHSAAVTLIAQKSDAGPGRAGTVRRIECPAIRAAASYRVVTVAGPSAANRMARHPRTSLSSQAQIPPPTCHI